MTRVEKVKYLKIDRGRYYYQRRVPDKFQELLGFKKWQIPCGDVDYPKAVQLIVTWSEEHDELLAKLRTQDGYDEIEAANIRLGRKTWERHYSSDGASQMVVHNDSVVPIHELQKPWEVALEEMKSLDLERANETAPSHEVMQIKAKIARAKNEGTIAGNFRLPPYPELLELAKLYKDEPDIAQFEFDADLPRPMSDERYRDCLTLIYDRYFPPSSIPPDDPDDRDEYVFVKRRLERKVASVTVDPNNISTVLGRYCDFNSIRSGTKSKYRRELARLIAITGDVPISHVRTEDLRQLRDELIGNIQPASIQAIFTPIKGIFSFAFDEDIIRANPMIGVKLPKDKRPIEERKWKPFEPLEFSRILEAAQREWGESTRGLTDARREAIHMVVRVLAFSGMRPIEVIRLKPDDVNDKLVRINGSKTESSTRVVPLHPEIKDFPTWLAGGGLDTFQSINTDKVGSVRHNFSRLLREKMAQPITDPQKALYSLRSTFVNAMRRAGADIQVQRAILGHKEAGAIRHYDDGPEFDVKRRWIEATDPRQV
ncbi:tyrosine-type recombinase/integrase [Sulfitobacter mediterraneus]|uniref:tyrosine-type recombinase/integrase n=1 Tax=Sulfitobacter mediterraneus TaxID=83219 RepID=UPI00248F64B4|nr:tyrosine-type recombinase/integrase [Sulfitobacter mediterraneus]